LFIFTPFILNYLAHIFLSGNDSQLQVGNFIGDFVKGKKPDDYPKQIRKGIILHRHIDSFTDSHEVVKETIIFLRPTFGRYSGIVADMYFDYFLAKDFSRHNNGRSLLIFAVQFYISALINYRQLPVKVKRFIFHFIFTNRLGKYSTLEGLKDSLDIMAIHKVSALNPPEIIEFLALHHEYLEMRFQLFFPDLIEFVKKENN